MKKEDYTINDFLDILECYRIMILRDGKNYPGAVLSDIEASTRGILQTFNYNKRIKKYMGETNNG